MKECLDNRIRWKIDKQNKIVTLIQIMQLKKKWEQNN